MQTRPLIRFDPLVVPAPNLDDKTEGIPFYVSDPDGAYLIPDSATTPMCSLDGAQRNPGIDAVANHFPRISLALHAGYLLRHSGESRNPECR